MSETTIGVGSWGSSRPASPVCSYDLEWLRRFMLFLW